MMTNRKNSWLILLGIGIVLLSCLFALVKITNEQTGRSVAFADIREKEMTVEQTSDLYYCGEDFLVNSDNRMKLYSVFSYKLNDEKITVDPKNISITNYMVIKDPDQYNCNFRINHEGKTYEVLDVILKISKKTVTVTALLNGEQNLVVAEGTEVRINYDYSGAAESDVIIETVNGVQVNTLKETALTHKAYVDMLPKSAVTNYTVVASSARSDYYDFVYQKTTLTIVPVIVPELTVKSKDVTLASVTGNFGNTYQLKFDHIGASASSEKFSSSWEKIKSIYSGEKILTDYDKLDSFEVKILVSEEVPYDSVPGNVKINMDEKLRKKDTYRVIALYNNGDSDILDAAMNVNGELVFEAADMGYFVVISPTEGISVSTYIIVIVCGVAFVLLVIFFVALFRRKY